jgi:hypothetical protein
VPQKHRGEDHGVDEDHQDQESALGDEAEIHGGQLSIEHGAQKHKAHLRGEGQSAAERGGDESVGARAKIQSDGQPHHHQDGERRCVGYSDKGPAGNDRLADGGDESADHQELSDLQEIVAGMIDRFGQTKLEKRFRFFLVMVVIVPMIVVVVVGVVMVMGVVFVIFVIVVVTA